LVNRKQKLRSTIREEGSTSLSLLSMKTKLRNF
jgi:hypothetical protein